MYLSRIYSGIIFLVYSTMVMGQGVSASSSASNNNVQSQLDSLKTQLNDVKYQLNLIVKLLQDRTPNDLNMVEQEYSNLTSLNPKKSDIYIDSFVKSDEQDSIINPSDMRLKRLGMTAREYFTQNTPQDEVMVYYEDNEGKIIGGSGRVDGISLRPKMYREAYKESKGTQNPTINNSSSSASDIAREIRKQEANAKVAEAATKLVLDAIFSPKK